MADSHLDDVDRLAAALAGFRAAGLVDQPFEMAKLLIEQGWVRLTPREVLLRVLQYANGPLTFTEMLHRGLGRPYGGRAAPEWRTALQELADEGLISRPSGCWEWRLVKNGTQ